MVIVSGAVELVLVVVVVVVAVPIVREKVCLAVAPLASVTCTGQEKFPVWVVVPESVPVLLEILMPPGMKE